MKHFLNKGAVGRLIAGLLAVALFIALFANIDFKSVYADSAYSQEYTAVNDETLDRLSNRSNVSEEAPQITVFMHGFGSQAFHWCNDGKDNFAYQASSMPEQLRKTIGEDKAEIYVIKTKYEPRVYAGYGKNKQDALSTPIISTERGNNGGSAYLQGLYSDYKSEMDTGIMLFGCNRKESGKYCYPNIYQGEGTDFSSVDTGKHLILIFDQWLEWDTGENVKPKNIYGEESNDYVYSQFEYCLDAVSYQYCRQTGELPTYNLIAHSRGGLTVMQYALAHPYNVASIFTMGAPFDGSALGSLSFGDANPCLSLAKYERSYKYSDGVDYAPGILDIIDHKAVTDSYRSFWNDNYTASFSHINFCPIGSYVTAGFFIQTMIEAICGVINIENEIAVGVLRGMGVAAEGWFDGYSIKRIDKHLKVNLLLSTLNILKEFSRDTFLYPYINAVANLQTTPPAYEHIGNYSFANFVYLDDLFIDLDSQIAKGYKGANVRVKSFDSFDQMAGEKNVDDVGVAHNLETHNKDIVNYIVNRLDTGETTKLSYQARYTDDGCYITGLNAVITNGILEIPDNINGYSVIGIDGLSDSIDMSGDTPNHSEILEIIIPASVKIINDNAFLGMNNLQRISFVQNNVEYIGNNAFAFCSSLEEIELGEKLNVLGAGAFYGCASLSSFVLSNDNTKYSISDGVLYSDAQSILVAYPGGKQQGTFVLPVQTTRVASGAFSGNQNLLSINLNNVSVVEASAFAGCSNIADIVADNLVYADAFAFTETAWRINQSGDYISIGDVLLEYKGNEQNVILNNYKAVSSLAFFNSENLETVTFGNKMRTLGAFAFFGCANLNNVYLNNLNNIIYVGTNTFADISEDLSLYVPQRLLEDYKSDDLWQQYADDIKVHSTKVKYILNGGKVGGQTTYESNINYGGYLSLPMATRTGYTFDGWYGSSNFIGNKAENGSLWTSSEDEFNLYAKWIPIDYTITYQPNGGTISKTTEVYTIENSVTYAIPVKNGYSFDGWYKNEALTEPAGASLSVGSIGNRTIYAKWEANTYSVTLNLNDNAQFPAKPLSKGVFTVKYDSANYSFEVPKRDGFTFNGWKVDGVLVTSSDGTANQTWKFNRNVTAYADWTRNTYFIKIDANGKIVWLSDGGFTDVKNSIQYGAVFDTATEMEEQFNPDKLSLKEGHKFDYFILSDGTKFTLWDQVATKYNAGDIIEINAHFTVEKNFNILFIDPNDPGKYIGYIQKNYDEGITLISPTKRGNTFLNWEVARVSQNLIFEGTKLKPTTVFNFTKMPDLSIDKEEDGTTIVLEAKFSVNSYTINFITQYGTAPSSTTIDFGSKRTLNTPSSVSGRVFDGWFTSRTGGTQITNSNGSMINNWDYTSNTTLYAQWHNIIYTITYINGYTHSNPTTFTIDDLPINLKDASRNDNRFMGWYNSTNFVAANRVEKLTTIGNKTLNAYWEQLYTVSFNSNGGTEVDSIQGIKGQEIKLPSPTRSKYIGTWNYWGYLTNNAQISNFGYSYIIGTTNITLTAIWKSLEYTAYFNQNGGSGGTTSIKVTVGEEMPSITIPTRTGYYFSGYYDSTGEMYPTGSTSKIYDRYSNTTYTARWSPRTWTISFWVVTGTVNSDLSDSIEMTYDQVHPVYGRTLTAPDIDGWNFKEWRKFYEYFQLNYEDAYFTNEKTITIHNVYPVNRINYFLAAVYEEACVAEGTMITLADGTLKAVEELSVGEELLVWNLWTGTFDKAPILFIDSDARSIYKVINLRFSDETIVKVISEHGFWDITLNKYVYLDKDAAQYIGHWFNKQELDSNGNFIWSKVQLVGVTICQEWTTAYSPVTYGHLCYYVNGMLSMPGGIDGMFNIFEVDGETMKYDAEAMAADIEEYGLYTYEEFNTLVSVPEEMFEAVNGQYLKVAVGKGLITIEQIQKLVDRYVSFFE